MLDVMTMSCLNIMQAKLAVIKKPQETNSSSFQHTVSNIIQYINSTTLFSLLTVESHITKMNYILMFLNAETHNFFSICLKS